MTIDLTVKDVTCDGCEDIVLDALEGVSGVEEASVDREAKRATVEGDADVDDLVRAVEMAGYEASSA